jgi:hypothetical protein
MPEDPLMLLNLSVPTAAKYLLKIVRNMVKILLSLNANFAVALLSGFVGEILIFANRAINGNAKVTT